ncbi:phage associated protein [Ferriphaselus amnicola]|uniref:Phage associated protein n=1 Tax=Ferriphaselus amnicola TaxID=1188319 RepID=A0A2Z6GDU1_9PROT|nr:DUF2786 domain-containing protein [Ferriphaselus amnicola]BBE51793.1 phage associated protein [Ferriphaselus amnicola]
MSDSRKDILKKIKKCLALSASSNEHEAEAALRQARALMEKHGIDDQDVLAFEASEQHAKAGAQSSPPLWEQVLSNKVADAFGCQVIFSSGWALSPAKWKFIGCGVHPEVATYAFQVLHRQCKRARAEFISDKLKRCKQATKTRRADLFCQGWLHAVSGKITALIINEREESAIDAYVAKNYPSLRDLKRRDRNAGRNLSDRECNDIGAGYSSGKNAELNRGVGGAEQIKLGAS